MQKRDFQKKSLFCDFFKDKKIKPEQNGRNKRWFELSSIKSFLKEHFCHFNAAALVEAAEAYSQHLDSGGKMLVTLAGAMSTAEIGKSLAQMIRQGKVHGISCTGANLEEDLMNLVAHNSYKRVPHYRSLSAQDEVELYNQGFNRVTDTCIPEEEAFRKLQSYLIQAWRKAQDQGHSYFPHEYLYQLILSGELEKEFEIDPKNSWLYEAAQHNLPIVVPGWEDSTTGNIFASYCIKKELQSSIVKSGTEYMVYLADWYQKTSKKNSIGFFQVGGGIAGDFPICVVPMLHQDLELEDTPLWGYFCQISDSTPSFGSYSGAPPNEKITWGKLSAQTPRFVIESDASIVAPLIFAYILGW